MTDIFPDEFEDSENEESPDEEELKEDELEDEEAIETSEDFAEKYGFVHDCHCGEDWASGNLAVVSVCYVNMIREALDALAEARKELTDAEVELANLRIQVVDQDG